MSHPTAPSKPNTVSDTATVSDIKPLSRLRQWRNARSHSKSWQPAPWQTEQLYFNSLNYFADILAQIDQAQHNIIIESYIFDCDDLGKKIINALALAHQRGVYVRVLMDGIGSSTDGYRAAAELEAHSIDVKIYRPLPWRIFDYNRGIHKGSIANKLLSSIRRINQRTHRKLIIIDNTWLWSGSLNISQRHLPLAAGGEGWKDYGVGVCGKHIQAITEQFDDFWLRRPIRTNPSLFRYYWNTYSSWSRIRKNRLLLEKIEQAQDRILITSAYFAPSTKIIRALKRARRRQVDIQILVTAKSDVHLFPLLTASYYADLLRAGIHIYEYQPCMLHAKALLIDDFCLIGSTNFNHRSFLHDRELDIVLTQPESLQQLQNQFMLDRADSVEVTLSPDRVWRWRLLGWLPRLLRYWL